MGERFWFLVLRGAGLWQGRHVRRGRRVLLVLLGCAVVAVIIAVAWPREREPVYQGKKLSEWMALYSTSRPASPAQLEAAAAVRQIGTNALPHLLRWIVRENPAWREKAVDWGERILRPVSKSLSFKLSMRPRYASSPNHAAVTAMLGFKILGQEAKSAVPELARIVNGGRRQPAANAMQALAYIGQDGFPVLLTVVTNTTRSDRIHAVSAIASLSTNVPGVIPALVDCMRDSDWRISRVAGMQLSQERWAADLAVPILIRDLQSTNRCLTSLISLERYGELARPAVPVLIELLNHTSLTVREVTTNALRVIAPEVFWNQEK